MRNGLDRGELIAKLLELGEASPARSSDWTLSFRSPPGGARRTVGPAGRTCGLPWDRRARICSQDAKTPSGGARVSEIHIRKNGFTRQTEKSEDAVRPKSVFQIGGAGAVGTGSIRGMPHLLTLARNGFGIWPFSEGWPRVVEIYPRALTGPVNKGRWSARHDYLLEHFPEQPRDLLERAAGSEDAFDGAVSALVMSKQEAELRALGSLADPAGQVEGKIWRPR
jgi:hypothetical protein